MPLFVCVVSTDMASSENPSARQHDPLLTRTNYTVSEPTLPLPYGQITQLTPAPRFQHRQVTYLPPASRLEPRRVPEPLPTSSEVRLFGQSTGSPIGELLLVLGPELIQPGQFLWPVYYLIAHR